MVYWTNYSTQINLWRQLGKQYYRTTRFTKLLNVFRQGIEHTKTKVCEVFWKQIWKAEENDSVQSTVYWVKYPYPFRI